MFESLWKFLKDKGWKFHKYMFYTYVVVYYLVSFCIISEMVHLLAVSEKKIVVLCYSYRDFVSLLKSDFFIPKFFTCIAVLKPSWYCWVRGRGSILSCFAHPKDKKMLLQVHATITYVLQQAFFNYKTVAVLIWNLLKYYLLYNFIKQSQNYVFVNKALII